MFFVTGTDTDVGKTLIGAGLLLAARKYSDTCFGIKPVAVGCETTPDGLRNDDALDLMRASSVRLDYDEANPVAFKHPAAPHIAVQLAGGTIDLEFLVKHCQTLAEKYPGFMLVEGAGGWRVPLNERQFISDLPVRLKMPVILVVAMRLGCISHSILTVESIRRDGLEIAGWVANSVSEEMPYHGENLLMLEKKIKAPLLGCVPFIENVSAESVATHLNPGILFSTK